MFVFMAVALQSPLAPRFTRRRALKLDLLLGQDRCHVFVSNRSLHELFVLQGLEGAPPY